VQPDNLEILINHLKCAAFELPIAGETFGGVDVPDLCERLAEAGFFIAPASTGTGRRRPIPRTP
jgi:hypothetical protein